MAEPDLMANDPTRILVRQMMGAAGHKSPQLASALLRADKRNHKPQAQGTGFARLSGRRGHLSDNPTTRIAARNPMVEDSWFNKPIRSRRHAKRGQSPIFPPA